MTKKITGVYGILPADLEDAELLEKAEAALKGGVRILQFRDKKNGFKKALKRAKALRELTSRYEAIFIVNDSIQLAKESAADGVHLGRDDIANMIQVRLDCGDEMIIGITCRADAALAQHALASGADYVSFGAVFGSKTKPEVPTLGLPRLVKARQLFPNADIVAIGGITIENMEDVKACNPDSVALISGLFEADEIELRARELVAQWSAG